MEHTLYVCPGGEDHYNCQFCDGGLSACSVCNAFEGAWPDECPGVKMQPDESDAVYHGHRNFRDGQWRDECCEVMRPVHDRDNYMLDAGYFQNEHGHWEKFPEN